MQPAAANSGKSVRYYKKVTINGTFQFFFVCLRASMSLVSNACSTAVFSSEFIVAGTSRSEYISDIFCVTGRLRLCTRIRRSPVTKKIQ